MKNKLNNLNMNTLHKRNIKKLILIKSKISYLSKNIYNCIRKFYFIK